MTFNHMSQVREEVTVLLKQMQLRKRIKSEVEVWQSSESLENLWGSLVFRRPRRDGSATKT